MHRLLRRTSPSRGLNVSQTARASCKLRRVEIVQGFRGNFAKLRFTYAAA
jgi:hypothetical protein